MPFKSENQRRYLWMKHPKMARKWAGEEKKMPNDKDGPAFLKGRKKKGGGDERMNAISRRLQKTMKGDDKKSKGKSGGY